MSFEREIKKFVENNYGGTLELLEQLCRIPAPSHNEEKRAEYCKKWLENIGAEGVYIDDALNTVFPLNCEGSDKITVFVAHTDTVFPDTEPMPYIDDGEIIHCPGVGDDTASLAVLLMCAKFFVENKLSPKNGILFVANSCEEGLGNLKGTRKIFENYAGRIESFVSLDSNIDSIADCCVGSHRYNVTVKTEGGHSFGKFGNENSIFRLAEIVTEIYKIKVPEAEGSKTTYNVGIISGGTSVNTIAENASMLCEYRSDNADCLKIMQSKFEEIFEAARGEKVEVNVTRVGERPCAENLDPDKQEAHVKRLSDVVESVIGKTPKRHSSSTDCNIPMSLGIPSVCVGVYVGGGAHTRAEWVNKKSLIPGLEVGLKSTLEFL